MERKLIWTQTGISAVLDSTVAQPFDVYGIANNSRTLKKGDLFFALKDQRDGHFFVAEALRRGAVAAVVERKPRNVSSSRLVYVANTMQALRSLAVAARRRSRARFVGITGTSGKTSTKDMLALVLKDQGNVHAAPDSYNNDLGVSLTLAGMPVEAAYGVFEMGMNHAGEIAPLSAIVRPDLAIITTIGEGHIGHFSDQQGIIDAKCEIFSGMLPGGIAILNYDMPCYDQVVCAAKNQGLIVYSYGQHKDCDIYLQSVAYQEGQTFMTIAWRQSAQQDSFAFAMPGYVASHMVSNILAVLSVVSLWKLDIVQAVHSLQHYHIAAGHGNLVPVKLRDGCFNVIDSSYNANPLSVTANLQFLANYPVNGGDRYVVLGDMEELGEFTQALHEKIAQTILTAGLKALYLCGIKMRFLADALMAQGALPFALHHFETQELLLKAISDLSLRVNDIVLVQASNTIKLQDCVSLLKKKTIKRRPVKRRRSSRNVKRSHGD